MRIPATLLITVSLLLSGCQVRTHEKPYVSYARTSEIMGTFMEIKIKDSDLSRKEAEKIIDNAFLFAGMLEKKLSIYQENSEINRLNISKKMVVSKDLFDVIKASKHAGILTNGDFDITVSPILKKDGFYSDMPADILSRIPDSTEGIGWHNILITPDRRIVLDKNTWIDLSGIAKGYIVDRVSAFIRNKKIKFFLVNAGGDIFCGDKEDNSPGWLVGIREPDGDSILKVLALRNKAIATSGDYENICIDSSSDKIISHIINPVTEEPLPEKPSSITVIADSCTEADALATGMMVMGEDKALTLADKNKNISVITSRKSGSGDVVCCSEGANDLVLEGAK